MTFEAVPTNDDQWIRGRRIVNNRRRRAFETSQGGTEVDQPILRAVLSFAPSDEVAMSQPTTWLTLAGESGAGAVQLRLACVADLGDGAPGPFGSVFYPGDHFEVVVPRRRPGQEVLLMINLLDVSAPRRFEIDTVLPDAWRLVIESDGSVTAVDEDGSPQVFISAPWAFDSTSARVPVRYSLENGTLVQNIDIDGHTSFPVLVDPDPDAIFSGDGHLVTESWTPRLIPPIGDVTGGDR